MTFRQLFRVWTSLSVKGFYPLATNISASIYLLHLSSSRCKIQLCVLEISRPIGTKNEVYKYLTSQELHVLVDVRGLTNLNKLEE